MTPAASTPVSNPAADADLLSFVREASPLVHRIGGAWFFTDPVREIGARAGITDRFALYAAGRGGVLGDCHPDVVASAFAFFPPPLVLAKYAEAVAVLPPRDCARVYARGLAAWGEQVLGPIPGVARLAELARRVAGSLRPMGLPLFAGWRAEPVPDPPAAAAALALHVLRELRGDLHIHAVTTHGLTPLQAILGGDGIDRARELRYPEPYPPLHEFAARRRAAEDLTDQLVAPAYATLTAVEQRELLNLLRAAAAALP